MKRKASDKEWHHCLTSSQRINLMNLIGDMIPQEKVESTRKKLRDLMVQSKSMEDFVCAVTAFICHHSTIYSIDHIKEEVEKKLGCGRPNVTIQSLPNNFPSLASFNSMPFTLPSLRQPPGNFATTPNNGSLMSFINNVVPNLPSGPFSSISASVIRNNEFNSELFEKFVERNKRVSLAINQSGINIEELMEQYSYCTELAKMWIVQDLIKRNEQSSVFGNEWQDTTLLTNLPFDLKFEIITFIPMERLISCWWIKYLKLRIISKSMKSRLEEIIFYRITQEGIDLSSVMHGQLIKPSVRKGILSLLYTHAEYVKQGNQFDGKFLVVEGTSEPSYLSTLTHDSVSKFDSKVIIPQFEDNQSIDYSKSFDQSYTGTLITKSATKASKPKIPFKQHTIVTNNIASRQSNLVIESRLPEKQEFNKVDICNPYIKSATISINRAQIDFIIDSLTNLEELTLIIEYPDFNNYPLFQFFNSKHLKLEKFNIIYYGELPITFFQMIETGKLDLMDFGGNISVYSDITDSTCQAALRLPMDVYLQTKIIKSTLDFKNLSCTLHPIRDFSVSKYIFEQGWYRKLERSTTLIADTDTLTKRTYFPFHWFNSEQIMELLQIFVDRYQFSWYNEAPQTELDESIMQYYLHLLNVEKKRLKDPTWNVTKGSSLKLMNMVVYGYNISLCPELIITVCSNFGKIGQRLVIENLKVDPHYIDVENIRSLIQQSIIALRISSIYSIVQLIPYIQNKDQVFDSYLKNGKKTNILLDIINQPEILVEYIIDNYVTNSNLESEVDFSQHTMSLFNVLLSSTLPNSLLLKLAKRNPKVLAQRNTDGNVPLHICFNSTKRIELVKPFIELAPETLDYEDNNGYKPYHLIPEYIDNALSFEGGIDLGLDFLKDFFLPDIVKDRLK